MARAVQLPKPIYCELLEEWLLLQAFENMWLDMGHDSFPPAFAMLTRNDLVAEACLRLESPDKESFLDYADQLSQMLPGACSYTFPIPGELVEHASAAESLAWSLLASGQGSYWLAARQVAYLLEYEKSRRRGAQHLSFTLGAYGHHSYTGILRHTHGHLSV